MKKSTVFAANAILFSVLSAFWFFALAMVIANDAWRGLAPTAKYVLVVGGGLPVGVVVMVWLVASARREERQNTS